MGTGAIFCYGDKIPTGYSAITSSTDDCDDAKATLHPGAAEVCGNGIDDNCDGNVDENCDPCANATNLRVTSITVSGVRLNWTASATPKQWQIQYKKLATGAKWTTLPGCCETKNTNGLFVCVAATPGHPIRMKWSSKPCQKSRHSRWQKKHRSGRE